MRANLENQNRDSLSFLMAGIPVNAEPTQSVLLLFIACTARIKLIPEEISTLAQYVSVLISPYLDLSQYQSALNELKQLIDHKKNQHIDRINEVDIEITTHHDKIEQLQPEFNKQLKRYRLAQLRATNCDATLFQEVKTVYHSYQDQLLGLEALKAHLERELSALCESTCLVEQMQNNLKL